MTEDAARYRDKAEDCRQQAERAINPLDKEAWFRLGEEWLRMAQKAEKQLR